MLCAVLMGCQDVKNQEVSLNDIIFSITDEYAIPSPSFLEKEEVTELIREAAFLSSFNFDESDILEAVGVKSMLDVSSDIVLAVKTDSDKIDRVEGLLTSIKSSIEEKFKDYIPSQYKKALNGDVFVIDDCVFLVIIGSSDDAEEFAEDITNKFF